MTAEQARDLYYQALNEAGDWRKTSGKPDVQEVMQIHAWEAVVAGLRKDYEQELERLRDENRGLKAVVLNAVEHHA